MKPRKEHYRGKLPHYQQPGQWYSITCILKNAIPKGAMSKYSANLEAAKNRYQSLVQKLPGQGLSQVPDSGQGLSQVPDSGQGLSKVPDSGQGLSKVPDDRGVGNSPSWRKSEFRKLEQAKNDYYIALRKYRLAYDKVLNKSKQPKINLTKDNNRKIIEEALLFWEGKKIQNHAWCIMSNHFHWILSVFEQELEFPNSNKFNLEKSNSKREPDFPKSGASYLQLKKSQSRELEFPNSNKFNLEKSNSKQEPDFPKSGANNLQPGKSQSRELEFPNSNITKPIYLQDLLHSVKLFTAREINKNENRSGQLWEHESFDTTLRDEKHFVNAIKYVIENPVSAGLVESWKEWPGTRIFEESDFLP